MTRHPGGAPSYAMTAVVHGSFDDTLSATRQALATRVSGY